jgi:hypothetical protein
MTDDERLVRLEQDMVRLRAVPLRLEPGDLLVLESDTPISEVARLNIQTAMSEYLPQGCHVVVLERLRLGRVVRPTTQLCADLGCQMVPDNQHAARIAENDVRAEGA